MNSLGVLLSAVGAFLVWLFIAELNFAEKDEYLKGRGSLKIGDPSPAEIKKFKTRIWFSRIGLILILVGGAAANHQQLFVMQDTPNQKQNDKPQSPWTSSDEEAAQAAYGRYRRSM